MGLNPLCHTEITFVTGVPGRPIHRLVDCRLFRMWNGFGTAACLFSKPMPPRMRGASCPLLESTTRLASSKRIEIRGLCCLCCVCEGSERWGIQLHLVVAQRLSWDNTWYICWKWCYKCILWARSDHFVLFVWLCLKYWSCTTLSLVKGIVWHFVENTYLPSPVTSLLA